MRTDGRTDRQTEREKLIVAFRNFANAPKKHLKLTIYEMVGNLLRLNCTVYPTRYRTRWLADRCSVSQQLGALETHTTDTFLFISHTTNVLLFKFRSNIFMPDSVSSGTTYIICSLFSGWIIRKGSHIQLEDCLNWVQWE